VPPFVPKHDAKEAGTKECGLTGRVWGASGNPSEKKTAGKNDRGIHLLAWPKGVGEYMMYVEFAKHIVFGLSR